MGRGGTREVVRHLSLLEVSQFPWRAWATMSRGELRGIAGSTVAG